MLSVGIDDSSAEQPESSEGDPEPFSLMHSLPLYCREPLLVSEMATALLPSRTPGLLAVIGYQPDSPDVRRIVVNFETPTPYLFLASGRISKPDLERVQLDRFMIDRQLVTGTTPFEGRISAQTSPLPDFVAEAGDRRLGIDCVQFGERDRREAHASIAAIRDAIMTTSRDRFQHLAGSLVYIWFGHENYKARAYRSGRDKEAIEALLAALEGYRVDPDAVRNTGAGDIPEKHPRLNLRDIPGGGRFYAIPLFGEPRTRFFMATGLELGMGFSFVDSGVAGWDRVAQMISDHDKPNYDVLLVTVGGPDRAGLYYISEELVLAEMLSHAPSIPRPQYVTIVYLHSWETGAIWRLVWGSDEVPKETADLEWWSPPIRPSSINVVPLATPPFLIGGDRPLVFTSLSVS